jgi:hypothetical protein
LVGGIGVYESRVDKLRTAIIGCEPVAATPLGGRPDDTTMRRHTTSTADGQSSGIFAVTRSGTAAVNGA